MSWPSTAAGPPTRCRCPTLVRVAGRRWTIEETFQAGKGLAGLDQHQVRALDLLAPLDHPGHARPRLPGRRRRRRTTHHTGRHPDTAIPLTRNEIRRLFGSLILQTRHNAEHLLTWSRWRRKHQANARAYHYRKQHQQQ